MRLFFRAMASALLAVLVLFSAPAFSAALLHPIPGKPQALDFELADLDGKTHRLSDYKGKTIILNFWATWCPPCRAEIPSMQRAWSILKDKNIVMLAVHVGGNDDKVWSFLSDYDVDFTVLMDGNSAVSRRWPMAGLPTTFIIDPKGRVALRAIGGRKWDSPDMISSILALGRQNGEPQSKDDENQEEPQQKAPKSRPDEANTRDLLQKIKVHIKQQEK